MAIRDCARTPNELFVLLSAAGCVSRAHSLKTSRMFDVPVTYVCRWRIAANACSCCDTKNDNLGDAMSIKERDPVCLLLDTDPLTQIQSLVFY